jgi:predicted DNA-binding transcriptional regulator AlpA
MTDDLLTDRLLSTGQAALYLGFTARMLEARRVRGDSPKFIRISRRAVRYRWSDLQDWLDKRVRQSTSDE